MQVSFLQIASAGQVTPPAGPQVHSLLMASYVCKPGHLHVPDKLHQAPSGQVKAASTGPQVQASLAASYLWKPAHLHLPPTHLALVGGAGRVTGLEGGGVHLRSRWQKAMWRDNFYV